MTNVTTKNQPALTLRDGSLSATIWGNRSDNGVRYSVDLARNYLDEEDKWKSTSYLSNGEILRGARLLEKAYDAILELRQQDKANREVG